MRGGGKNAGANSAGKKKKKKKSGNCKLEMWKNGKRITKKRAGL